MFPERYRCAQHNIVNLLKTQGELGGEFCFVTCTVGEIGLVDDNAGQQCGKAGLATCF